MSMIRSLPDLLVKSIKLLIKNPLIFVPLLVMIIPNYLLLISPLYTDFMQYSISSVGPFPWGATLGLIAVSLVLWVLCLFVYGWILSSMNAIVTTGNFMLFSNRKLMLSKTFNLFILLLFTVLAYFVFLILMIIVGIIVGMLGAILPILALFCGIILLIIAIPFIILLTGFFIQLTGVLIVENVGPIVTLGKAWTVFRKRLGNSILMALMSMIIVMISFVPLGIIIYGIIGYGSYSLMVLSNPIMYIIISFVSSIPYIIVMYWLMLMYGVQYLEARK